MGVIKFMGKETEDCLGMKLGKIKPVRGSTVGSHKKGKKVLKDLNCQITVEFFMILRET